MPSFEALVFLFVFLLLLAIGLSLVVVLRSRSRGSTVTLTEAGEFRRALETLEALADPERDDLLAGGRAARNLLDLKAARRLVDRLLDDDPADGEAWLERALIETCAREFEIAREAFARVPATRSDLLESTTLHRAWSELFAGDVTLAQRLFDEVEVPLETKLRDDIGPGDPMFAEWFLHAGYLWRSRGSEEKAKWALSAGRAAAPESSLPDFLEQWWMER
jgi:tetratricopeptide (TPR) repeat protein